MESIVGRIAVKNNKYYVLVGNEYFEIPLEEVKRVKLTSVQTGRLCTAYLSSEDKVVPNSLDLEVH